MFRQTKFTLTQALDDVCGRYHYLRDDSSTAAQRHRKKGSCACGPRKKNTRMPHLDQPRECTTTGRFELLIPLYDMTLIPRFHDQRETMNRTICDCLNGTVPFFCGAIVSFVKSGRPLDPFPCVQQPGAESKRWRGGRVLSFIAMRRAIDHKGLLRGEGDEMIL